MKTHCDAYQASDQMICPTCHIGWDMNDPEPPPCPKTRQAVTAPGGVKLVGHLDRINRENDRRQAAVNVTSNQRRAKDPGEFKVGPGPAATPGMGRRFIDNALKALAGRTQSLDMREANPGTKPKKED